MSVKPIPLLALLVTAVWASPSRVHAQAAADSAPPTAVGKPSEQRLKAREQRKKLPGLPQGVQMKNVEIRWAPPDPYGKFVALDKAFKDKVDWKGLLAKIDKNINENDYTDTKFILPLVIGARICDGVMAVKVRNEEKLNEAANDIEALGRKLGVTEEDLLFAKTIRAKALAGEWLEVYTNLSMLQNRVQKTLRGADPLTAALVMTGGWMRGATYVGSAVQGIGDTTGDMGAHPSYFMREPDLVFYLADEMEANRGKNPARAAELAKIEAYLDEIACLINIDSAPNKGKISAEGVNKILSNASAILTMGFDNK